MTHDKTKLLHQKSQDVVRIQEAPDLIELTKKIAAQDRMAEGVAFLRILACSKTQKFQVSGLTLTRSTLIVYDACWRIFIFNEFTIRNV